MSCKGRARAALMFCLAAVIPVASAQESAAPVDRFYATGAITRNDTDFGVRWDYADVRRGTDVDFRDDLGMPEFSEKIWEAGVTLGAVHRFQATGWNFGQGYGGKTTRPVFVDGFGPAMATPIVGSLDLDLKTASYTWFFLSDEKRALGFGLGAARFDLYSKLDLYVGGFPGQTIVDTDFHQRLTAPLARTEYVQVFGAWRLVADVSHTRKSGGSTDMVSTDASVGMEFLPAPLVALGLRYNVNRADFEFLGTSQRVNGLVGSNFSGAMRIRNSGPQLYLMLRY